ncbi:MAG: serine acetyltransferase [Clostridiales bacterium]|nr:MAG: serine acetyltransferase [Clostridiales bacterium]
MGSIIEFMRYRSQDLADELVNINSKQLMRDTISGFGMKARVIELAEHLKAALFPTLYEREISTPDHLPAIVLDRVNTAVMELNGILEDVFINSCNKQERAGCDAGQCRRRAADIAVQFMEKLPYVRQMLGLDMKAAYDGDPAAKTYDEILLSYPSMEAITIYRIAHELVLLQVPLIPRIMSEYAHQLTGIDIHPGATIGKSFFIDHGTGVVIGETTKIGDHVKLYQGVTLGAKSFELDSDGNPVKGIKRHPNIEDDVVIYAGATILGGDVTIGKGSVIGGNVWLTVSVPPYTTVYNSTPKPIMKIKKDS